MVRLSVGQVTFDLITDAGVFSAGRIDRGTFVLLESLPAPPQNGNLLDLGCGYGVIALVLAKRTRATVWAVDVNARALDLVRVNAERLKLPNVIVAAPDQVPERIYFDAIYSNPPVRIGRQRLRPLIQWWLNRLTVEGAAYLVISRHLGADPLARWLTDQGFSVVRIRSKGAYRVIRVTR